MFTDFCKELFCLKAFPLYGTAMAQYMRGNETVFETPDVDRAAESTKTVPIAMVHRICISGQ